MRRFAFVAAVCTLIALPLAAQNTDIESLSGLQFNFGNPGARSLGMGGAFLGLADDASAAEANPAGLTILRKPEISIEGRNYQEQQVFTTSGTYPDLVRTGFSHYSQRIDPTFASFVYPTKHFTFGAYYHEPLRNEGTGQVVPIRNDFTGQIKTDVPNFYLPVDTNGNGIGGPVNFAQCQALRQKSFPGCIEYTVLPFLSSVKIQEKTFGLAVAYKIGNFSFGATARAQRFNETAFTFRVTPTGDFSSISVQATSDIRNNNDVAKDKQDITFTGGFKWAPSDKFSVGGVYKQGAKYVAPTFASTENTNFQFVKVADTTFHIPDVYGLGVSVRPIPVLTINADAVRVKYSNLVDDFVSINSTVRAINKAYKADDALELHLGGEYFFSTKIPFAVRAGYWRDPEHSITYTGPVTNIDEVGPAILFPKTKALNHVSVGAGLAWPRFQIDAAYDRSQLFRVGSISMVTRF
ncbi:MAG TPA: outer membrane protein transport protein [Thermoanaerobaculia bacterium]|jgi:long-subunit fatty acid transport protein|nr:outer membrane protein transport protein [Thermoanaerobaculia bacterium]